ncbi:LOW QUALITY PROTEIN: RNA-binding motif protein, X-linked 2-like [Rhynchonycteris naso]
MNSLTKVRLISALNEREVQLRVADEVSWHTEYKDSAWIFLGGLPYKLTEGDVICVFSQCGEIVNINLVRDKKTGKSKGFCFLCYEDQRSTILAVDNFNGIKIKGRTIRVDHVSKYRTPKDSEEMDIVTKELQDIGHGASTPSLNSPEGSEEDRPTKEQKKEKKQWKKDKETYQEEVAEPPASSSTPRSRVVKEEDDIGSKKQSSKNPEHREVRKLQSSSPELGLSSCGTAGARERELKKENSKQEHKPSSRIEEREERNSDRDRSQSSHTRGLHERHSEGDSHRSRGRIGGKSQSRTMPLHPSHPDPWNASDLIGTEAAAQQLAACSVGLKMNDIFKMQSNSVTL